MPREQRFAFANQTIGTGRWQPVESGQVFAGQFDAVFFERKTTLVVAALTGFDIQLVAGNVGEIDFFGIFINQLVQATLSATVAQCFPFFVGHFRQRLFLPKSGFSHSVHPVEVKLGCLYRRFGRQMQAKPPESSSGEEGLCFKSLTDAAQITRVVTCLSLSVAKISSPAFNGPTPCGVPVRMMSPARRVKKRLM